eukprot:scaffold161145_cov41-Prasinocladus_malaysianus.AAC.1
MQSAEKRLTSAKSALKSAQRTLRAARATNQVLTIFERDSAAKNSPPELAIETLQEQLDEKDKLIRSQEKELEVARADTDLSSSKAEREMLEGEVGKLENALKEKGLISGNDGEESE